MFEEMKKRERKKVLMILALLVLGHLSVKYMHNLLKQLKINERTKSNKQINKKARFH